METLNRRGLFRLIPAAAGAVIATSSPKQLAAQSSAGGDISRVLFVDFERVDIEALLESPDAHLLPFDWIIPVYPNGKPVRDAIAVLSKDDAVTILGHLAEANNFERGYQLAKK